MVSCANNVGVCALMDGDPAFAVDLLNQRRINIATLVWF